MASSASTTAHEIHPHTQDQTNPSPIYTIKPTGDAIDPQDGGSSSITDDLSAISSEDDTVKGYLCDWADLPRWMQDNPAIWTGYRRPTLSYKKCIASLGFLHNESGALVCIIASPIAYFKVFGVLDTIIWADIAVFYIFMAGATACLSMSASFHTFSCHSEPVAHQWNRCDYVGIVFLIVGSFYPAVYYGFYCHQTWQLIYITLITIFGVATIVAVIRPEFRTPHYRWIRSYLFLALGLCGVFPVIHGIILYGIPLAQKAVSLNYMICMGSSYVAGALMYASRTPERLFPGKMDHFGASHQIFHVLVLVGCLSHFLGVTKAMAFWHDANHTCAIPIAQMRIDYLT